MVTSMMIEIKVRTAKTFLAALCMSASFIIPASAADITLLPDIPADQIARDTARSFDSRTGVSIVTAPTFDPFEQDNTLAGTASLRTGPSETTIDGARVVGGAYLDLKMIYTSPSDDPYDLRGYENAYYVSGEPVARIRQETRTLDCASNTTEVAYQDDYYNNYDNYGYLAGLYLLLPRYRGHRGYWDGGSRYRPSAGWSDWRRRGAYGGYGGSYGHNYGGHNGESFGTQGNGGRGHNGGHGTRSGGTGHSGNGNGSSAGNNNGTGSTGVRTGSTPRTEHHNARNAVIGGSAENRSYTRQRSVVTGGPLQPSRSTQAQPERQNTRSSNNDRGRDRIRTHERLRAESNVGRLDRGRGSNSIVNTTRQPIARTGRPAIRETITNRSVNPAGAAPSPIARSAPPRPVRAAPTRRPEPRTERKSSPKPVSKPRPTRRIDREVDRSFRKNTRATRGKRMEFFPMLGGYTRARTTVVTNYRCVREESVTLHIPQDRLDAARFDGMTLIIVDNADRDVPIYLPPNYIEGFRQAAGRNTAAVVTPQPSYTQPTYSEPTYSQPRYPQN